MSRYTRGGAYGVPLMKFTLIYDGELPATSNGNSRCKEKWAIRKQLDPQLRELWKESEVLQMALRQRLIPTGQAYMRLETHHSLEDKIKTDLAGPNMHMDKGRMDLCEEIPVASRRFLPLVRESFALRCGLSIKFLRKEEPGKLIQPGGDMDNRLKTLFDALSVPNKDQIEAVRGNEDTSVADPIHCLMEDDSLISALAVETQKLLTHPDASKSQVRLVIDVDVRVIRPKAYNEIFLGD